MLPTVCVCVCVLDMLVVFLKLVNTLSTAQNMHRTVIFSLADTNPKHDLQPENANLSPSSIVIFNVVKI